MDRVDKVDQVDLGLAGKQYRGCCEALLEPGVAASSFVHQALKALEGLQRGLALVALEEWHASGVRDEHLIDILGGIGRPSWGTWSSILRGLLRQRARLAVEQPGSSAALIQSAALTHLHEALETPLPPEEQQVGAALAAHLEIKGARFHTRRSVLERCISLRNRIVHDLPSAEGWWERAAAALRPVVAWAGAVGWFPAGETVGPPWWVLRDGQIYHFNGLEKTERARYAPFLDGSPMVDREQAGSVLDRLARLLGFVERREQRLAELLSRASQEAEEDLLGVLLGDFLVSRQIGEGGFSTVYRGVHLSSGRRVAVKVLRDSLREEARTRFRREAEFLGRLNHENIVDSLGIDTAPWRLPGDPTRSAAVKALPWFSEWADGSRLKTFLALEWVDGKTLEEVYQLLGEQPDQDPGALVTAQAPRRASREQRERALTEWFLSAAGALAHVHEHGLVHRDIKPSNLMLTRRGEVRLMDFGIAKELAPYRTVLTEEGMAPGTLAYMAPEQWHHGVAGPQADVYALCATFYELYTGRRCFDHDRLSTAELSERKRAGSPPAMGHLSWEIGTLLGIGLQPDPADRFPSMRHLVDDLRRVLRNEPILSRPPGIVRRAQLFHRRHRAAVRVALISTLVLLLGTIAYVISVKHERDRANASAAAERTARIEAQRTLLQLLQEEGRRELLSGSRFRAAPYLAKAYALSKSPSPTLRFLTARALADIDMSPVAIPTSLMIMVAVPAFNPDGTRLVARGPDDRPAMIWDTTTGRPVASLGPASTRATSMSYSPDGSRIATTLAGGDTVIWDGSGRMVVTLASDSNPLVPAAFSPDGMRVLTAGNDGTASVWHSSSGLRLLVLRGHTGRVRSACFSKDGTLVATAGDEEDPTARVWNARTGASLCSVVHPGIRMVRFDPAGSRLITAGISEKAIIWDASTGKELAVFQEGPGVVGAPIVTQIREAVFSPDGSRVATVRGGSVKLWDAKHGEALRTFNVQRGGVSSVAFSPDGMYLLVGSDDKTAVVYDAESGESVLVLSGHREKVVSAHFSPDGRRVFTAGLDKFVLVFNAPRGGRVALLGAHGKAFSSAAFTPDGKRVVTARQDGSVEVWDAASWAPVVRFKPDGSLVGIARAGDDLRIVSATDEGTVRLWDARGKQVLLLRGRYRGVSGVAFSPNGSRLLGWSRREPGQVWAWDPRTGKLLLTLGVGGAGVLSASFSPSGGRILAVGERDGSRVFDAATGRLLTGYPEKIRVYGAAFSPDERRLVTTGQRHSVRLWGDTKGTLLAGHKEDVNHVAFSPDGRRFVTASDDRTAKIWDSESGKLLASLDGHRDEVFDAEFSPDGLFVLTSSSDRTARIWEAESGRLLAVLRGHSSWIAAAEFSPDGSCVVTASLDGSARVWDVRQERRDPAVVTQLVEKGMFRLVDGQVVRRARE